MTDPSSQPPNHNGSNNNSSNNHSNRSNHISLNSSSNELTNGSGNGPIVDVNATTSNTPNAGFFDRLVIIGAPEETPQPKSSEAFTTPRANQYSNQQPLNGQPLRSSRPSSSPQPNSGWSLKARATLLAVSMTALPVIALGGAIYAIGSHTMRQQAEQAKQTNQNPSEVAYITFLLERQMRMTVLMGTGITAAIASLIAVIIARRSIRPVVNASKSAALTANQLRQELNEPATLPDGNELHTLESELGLVANQLPGLLKRQKLDAELTQLLTDATLRLRECHSIDEILSFAVMEAVRAIGVDRVIVYRFNPDGSGTIITEHTKPGVSKIQGVTIMDPCFKERHIERYKDGQVTTIANTQTASITPCYREMLMRFSIQANLVTPIIRNDQLMGLLIAHQCRAPKDWLPAEVDFFSRLAMQVSYALDRRNLQEDQHAEVEAESLFNTITAHLRDSLKVEHVQNTAVLEVRKALNADRVILYRFNEDWSGTVVAESVISGVPRTMSAQIMDPCFRDRHIEQYRDGRVRAIDNIYAANLTDCHIELLSRYAVRANLVAPVIRDGQLIALLIAHQCKQARQWKPFEINVFARIATQIGYALEQTALLEKVELARQELEVELRPRSRAIAGTTMGICIADAQRADYPLVYCNPAFERMTGYTREEAVGRNCRFMQGPDTDPSALAEIRLALREKRECHVVLKNYRKDGTTFWNELAISPVRDEQGEVTHFVAWQTDISDRYEWAENVKSATQTLTRSTQDIEAALTTITTGTKTHTDKATATIATVQTMSDSIQTVASGVRQAKAHVHQLHQLITVGTATLSQAETSLSTILESRPIATRNVHHLDELARRIFEIMDTVNHAVTQTNLLAMNAVVEAGQTQGMATLSELMQIAEAVRSLTEQSAFATQEVEKLVGNLQTTTHTMVSDLEYEEEQLVNGRQWISQSRQDLSKAAEAGAQTESLMEKTAQTVMADAKSLTTVGQTLQATLTEMGHTTEQAAIASVSLNYLLEVAKGLKSSTPRFDTALR